VSDRKLVKRMCGAGLLTVGLLAGCAIDRPNFSMDSVSRLPWFGLDLLPSKKNEPNYQRSISRNSASENVAQAVRPAQTAAATESNWKNPLRSILPARTALPLPRTDIAPPAPPTAELRTAVMPADLGSPDQAVDF
jgi:hypothetical protein